MSSWDSRRRTSRSPRLRMDSYGRSNRSGIPPKRRELDNVMKKARRDGPDQSNYWNKKLLEVEEKDPNRWRHSGYKELYGSGTSSPNGSTSSGYRRSRSRSKGPSRTRNRSHGNSLPRAWSRSRDRDRNREREKERDRGRDRDKERDRARRPRSPPNAKDDEVKKRSPRGPSPSPSSVSSCSNESCSVCSHKGGKRAPVSQASQSPRPPPARSPVPAPNSRSRSRSFSVPRNRPSNRSPTSRRSPRKRERPEPPRDPRRPQSPSASTRKDSSKSRRKENSSAKKPKSRSKSRRTKRRSLPSGEGNIVRRRMSPPPSASDDSSSSAASGNIATKLTLSERFGRMAQWSMNRRDFDGVRNMRVTKTTDNNDFQVVIEGDRYRTPSPMPFSDRRVGLGYYPESLTQPMGLEAWDDVRVRYQYYRDRGYLRDLTLDDYMKWEEWWYKYQDWLEAQQYYEQWEALHGPRDDRRPRRRRR